MPPPDAIRPVRNPAGNGAGMLRTMLRTWDRADWLQVGALLGVMVLIHAVAFGVLFGIVAPAHYQVGSSVFGVGLGITAYTYGLRHAFDADHIAAIDNTTRKLRGDGRRPKAVGFWFALGHSTMVAALAALVAAGAHIAGDLTDEDSAAHRTLGLIATGVGGSFLYLIAALNLIALLGIVRVFRAMRTGDVDEEAWTASLNSRGLLNRILGRLTKTISRPGQMYVVGVLFGLGFDTATEVTLLVLAGSSAAAGLPWFAIMVLPLLFAAGMSLLDCLDGLFMSVAYDWAFMHPVRKVYYNLAITGLSVAVAFLIGSVELVTIVHDDLGLHDPVTGWISAIDMNNVGLIVVGLFVATWAIAMGYWRFARIEDRWAAGCMSP